MNKNELLRKSLHMLYGVILIGLLVNGIISAFHLFFFTFILIVLSIISRNSKIAILQKLIDVVERDHDKRTFPFKGALFYTLGCFFVAALFPTDIALASIAILAFGDSINHLFGSRYGKIRHPLNKVKFLEGTLAGFVVGFLAASFFVQWPEALMASLIAMIVEGIELKLGTDEIDDNIIIPIVAATAIIITRMIA